MANRNVIINTDQLALMSEDEIYRRRSFLIGLADRERNKAYSDSLYTVEEDLCYIFRELEVRKVRQNAHDEYLRKFSHNYYDY